MCIWLMVYYRRIVGIVFFLGRRLVLQWPNRSFPHWRADRKSSIQSAAWLVLACQVLGLALRVVRACRAAGAEPNNRWEIAHVQNDGMTSEPWTLTLSSPTFTS